MLITTKITNMPFPLLNFNQLLSFLLFLLLSIFLYKYLFLTKKTKVNLNSPPSPPKLPLIGHLHKLGKLPHRSLQAISNKYGEIILLHLGNKPTLIVSSSKYAQEIMKTHDLIFSNRPALRNINRIYYDGNDIVFNKYCPKWKYLKSICVSLLLNKKMVSSFRYIREEEIALMIEKIKSYKGSVVNLSESFMALSIDLISRAALGRKYSNYSKNGVNFHELFKELIEVLGAVSVADYIPILGWVDKLSGLENRIEFVRKHFDDFTEEIIREHQACIKEKDEVGGKVKDFVDVLLEFHRENPEQPSRDDIKVLILDMFTAGTETFATTMEWIMLELLRHPTTMRKLQEEIMNVVSDTRITEDAIENMKYLDAVVKETLRLHPPAPLLMFRETSEDVKVDNYHISERTQVIVNAWAIHHDPKFWQDPEKFIPERFLDTKYALIDYKDQSFDFIPFGAGRRSCPGEIYGIVSVKLTLASIIYEFNWTLPDGREGTTLSDEEGIGITNRPLNHVKAIASTNVV